MYVPVVLLLQQANSTVWLTWNIWHVEICSAKNSGYTKKNTIIHCKNGRDEQVVNRMAGLNELRCTAKKRTVHFRHTLFQFPDAMIFGPTHIHSHR